MKINTKILTNNLQSVVIPMEDTPTATVMVMVNAGSRHETKEQNGISHFLEHMFFKGTENRPSSHKVSEDLDKLGAESNAFTGHEYTAYYGKAQSEKIGEITEIIADIYQNSLFPKSEIEKEAGVITEEINMYKDLPMRLVHDLFQSHIYPDQPIGRNILGNIGNIQSFQQDNLINYRDNHYAASNTVVVVAGGVQPSKIHDLNEKQFENVKKSDTPSPKSAQPNPESHFAFRQKDADQTHLVLGGLTVARESEQLPAVELLSTILGRGMSSRLYQKLRDEMGVCYYVKSTADYFTDTGLFKVSTGITPNRLDEVVHEIVNSLETVAENGVDSEELQKAKEFAVGSFLLGHETTDDIARDIAKQSILDSQLEKPKKYTEKLRSVTSDEVKKSAQNIIEDGLYAAAIGPNDDTRAVENILR